MAEISIIVPVYKVEGQLLRCLESLRVQTFRDIEVICVDDGSPDRCGEMLDRFAAGDSRFTVLHRANGGLSAARNSGMALAKAPYLMFCDSDDYVEPKWCEMLYGAITESGADMAVCGVTCEGVSARDLSVQQDYFRQPYDGLHDMDERVLLETDACAWDKIFRRDSVVSAGISFAEGLRHEDEFFFWDYAIRASRIVYVSERLYHYVLRDGGIMGGQRLDDSAVFDYVTGFRGVAERMPSMCRFRLTLLRKLLRIGGYVLGQAPAAKRPLLLEDLSSLVESLVVGVDVRNDLDSFEQRELCRLLAHDLTIDFGTSRYAHGLVECWETLFQRTYYVAGFRVLRRRGRFARLIDSRCGLRH